MYQPGPPYGVFGPYSATVGVGRNDLVSGEAVALDLPPANIGLRILSAIVDIVVVLVAWYVLRWVALGVIGDGDSALILAANTLCVVFALVVLPTASETLTRGKTLGHALFGLRTVRDDAGPIGFRHALARAMLGVVEIYGCLGVPAFLSAVISRKAKRLGDTIAGTYVIRDRYRLTLPEPIMMPPELAGWAVTADVAPLPPALAVAVRQFFARRGSLKPAVRADLAGRLAVECQRFVAPRAPLRTPPELVMAAIMAERRRRDTERLARDEQLRRRLLR